MSLLDKRVHERNIQSSNQMMFDSFKKEIGESLGNNQSFDLIGLTELRNDANFAGIDGSGLSVAVIDSGIDTAHPLLQDNYLTGVDFFNGDDNPNDVVGHGTHVSGIIGASDRTIGVAPDVGLIGLKVGETQRVDYDAIANSLEWVLNNHQEYNIVAINMSLSGGFYTSEDWLLGDRRISLIQSLEAAGIVIVSSAGNSYEYKDLERTEPNQEPNIGVPAIYSTIAVGAVWQNDNTPFYHSDSKQIAGTDRIAYFSQRLNRDNFIFAPGTYINSTYPDDRFERFSGTSMASPHVAGAVALLQEAALQFGGRLLTPEEITAILHDTADTVFDGDDEEDFVTNTNTSYSRLNVYHAVAQVQRRFADVEFTSVDRDRNGTITQVRESGSSAIFSSQENIGEDGDVYVGDRDVDFWKISFDEPGILEIDLDASDNVDTVATLFDREGNRLAVNDDSDGLDPLLRYEITSDTDYYLGISGYGNEFDPLVLGSGSVGSTGDYTVSSDLLPRSQIDNLTNNSLDVGEIKEIEIGTTVRGNIGSDNGLILGADDIDLYRIVAPQNGDLDIRVNATGDGANTAIRLFDRDGDEIASDTSSYLQQEVTANTEYYIGINGYSDRALDYDPLTGENTAPGTEGDYNLSLSYEGDIDSLDTAIYRFQNTAIPGTYIYVDERERQNMKQNYANFDEEGKAFKVATEPEDNLMPIYRFQNNNVPGTYLFVGETERNNINQNFQHTFSEEGLAFYVYGADEGRGTTLYRFQNTNQPGTYIFVAEAERANIIDNYPSFIEEGSAFEVNI
jgi:hypothetical protein